MVPRQTCFAGEFHEPFYAKDDDNMPMLWIGGWIGAQVCKNCGCVYFDVKDLEK